MDPPLDNQNDLLMCFLAMSHNAHVTTNGCNHQVFSWMKDGGAKKQRRRDGRENPIFFLFLFNQLQYIVIVARIWHVYGFFFL